MSCARGATRRSRGRGLAVVAWLAFLSAGGLARADDPAALFDRGLADMRAHRYDAACPALAESYRLDPHAGGLFTLAECENQWGKTQSAVADYDRFLALVAELPARERSKQADRAKVAAERRAALARDVPSLTVSLGPDVPSGSTVSIDGRAVPPATLGTLMPLDPGKHAVVLSAPDGRSSDQSVSLAAGDARAITLVLPVAAPAVPAGAPSEQGSGWRTAAYVTGGIGVAAVVAGSVMGAVVLADKSTIDANCPSPMACASAADASSANSAKSLGWASTGAFVGGGAAIGAAIALWFLGPSEPKVVPVVHPLDGGVVVGFGRSF